MPWCEADRVPPPPPPPTPRGPGVWWSGFSMACTPVTGRVHQEKANSSNCLLGKLAVTAVCLFLAYTVTGSSRSRHLWHHLAAVRPQEMGGWLGGRGEVLQDVQGSDGDTRTPKIQDPCSDIYSPLCKVADTPFHIQGDEIILKCTGI